MINKDRIIPIQKTDYLSLITTIVNLMAGLLQQTISYNIIGGTADGSFTIDEAPADGLAVLSEPVKRIDFASGVPTAMDGMLFAFVPAEDFEGFYENGTKLVLAGDDVLADGVSLYVALGASDTFGLSLLTPNP